MPIFNSMMVKRAMCLSFVQEVEGRILVHLSIEGELESYRTFGISKTEFHHRMY